MTPKAFQRARQPHQKARRRADILRIARKILDKGELDDLTLNELARRVGLAKSNVYRYFESREAILLQVFQEDIRDLVDELMGRFGRMRAKSRIDRLASLLASGIAARPRLCLLNSLVGTVLERNVSVETCRQFKEGNVEEIQRLVAAMAKAVPELTLEQHGEVMQLFNALVVGLWANANPSAAANESRKDPSLREFRRDFEASLKRGVLVLAKGLVAEGPTEKRPRMKRSS